MITQRDLAILRAADVLRTATQRYAEVYLEGVTGEIAAARAVVDRASDALLLAILGAPDRSPERP